MTTTAGQSPFLVAALARESQGVAAANARVAARMHAHAAAFEAKQIRDRKAAEDHSELLHSAIRLRELAQLRRGFGINAPVAEQTRFLNQMRVTMSESRQFKGTRDANDHEADMRSAFGYTEEEFVAAFGRLNSVMHFKRLEYNERVRGQVATETALREAKLGHDPNAIPEPPALPNYLKSPLVQEVLADEQKLWGVLQRDRVFNPRADIRDDIADYILGDDFYKRETLGSGAQHWLNAPLENKSRQQLVREILQDNSDVYEREVQGVIAMPSWFDQRARCLFERNRRAPLGVAGTNAAPCRAVDLQILPSGDVPPWLMARVIAPVLRHTAVVAITNNGADPIAAGSAIGVMLDPAGGGSRDRAVALASEMRPVAVRPWTTHQMGSSLLVTGVHQETKAVAVTSAPAKAERTRTVQRAWKKAHKLDHKAQRAAQRAQQRGRR